MECRQLHGCGFPFINDFTTGIAEGQIGHANSVVEFNLFVVFFVHPSIRHSK